MVRKNAFDALIKGAKNLIECSKCGKIINWTKSGWKTHWERKHKGMDIPKMTKKRKRSKSPSVKRNPPKKRKPRAKTPPKKRGGSEKGRVISFHPIRWKLKRVAEYKKLKRGQKTKWLKKYKLSRTSIEQVD